MGGSEVLVVMQNETDLFAMQAIGEYKETQTASALKTRDYKDATDLVGGNMVRRLTPLECERLQGFPDKWTLIGEPEEVEVKDYEILHDEEGNEVEKRFVGTHTEIQYFYTDENGKKKKCNDSARYKALGNSIALPYWKVLARRICAQYDRDVTMGSLFDGIGGFPFAFECAGATPVWASEIEEFPIAVTKRRFPDVG